MQYCSKCHVLCESECPTCGNRRLTEPQAEDPARLATAEEAKADMLEGLLQDGGIPYEKRPAISVGDTGKCVYNFYVPCCRYEEAENIRKVVFPEPSAEVMPDAQPLETEKKTQTYRVKGEVFEVMPRRKRIFWRAFSAILFIVVVAVVVFATDAAAGWIKGIFA